MAKSSDDIGRMTPSERGHLFPIILSESMPEWHSLYCNEKTRIVNAVGKETIERIHHIGSTSVPGLLAKPTIDILLEIKGGTDIEKLIRDLISIGYLYESKPMNPAPGMMFMKGYSLQGFSGQAFHLHVRYLGDWNELYFCDYLRKHPEVAKKYAKVKLALKQKYEFDRDAYTEGKTAFCKEITVKARHALGDKYAISKRKMLARLKQAEIEYPSLFAQRFERPWGMLFLNPENPTSHDSNHAVITHGRAYRRILDEILVTFEQYKITPRIYESFRPGQWKALEPLLTERGFAIEKGSCSFLYHKTGITHKVPTNLIFKQQTSFDEGLFKKLFEESEWAYAMPVQKACFSSPRFYNFVGFLDENPVVNASILNLGNGLYRIDDVETVEAYRGHGYAREMMAYLIHFFEENIQGTLYLWVANPTARRIYEEFGFVPFDLLPSPWSAYRK